MVRIIDRPRKWCQLSRYYLWSKINQTVAPYGDTNCVFLSTCLCSFHSRQIDFIRSGYCFAFIWWMCVYIYVLYVCFLTVSSLMATHELGGNPCNIGTRNCRHPLQWPMSSIIQIKLKIFMKTEAIFKN